MLIEKSSRRTIWVTCSDKNKVKTGEGDIFYISVGSENRLNFGMSADV
jgi:hypothetical protein